MYSSAGAGAGEGGARRVQRAVRLADGPFLGFRASLSGLQFSSLTFWEVKGFPLNPQKVKNFVAEGSTATKLSTQSKSSF